MIYPYPDRLAQNFLLKRTASHGIELLGILTFRASPVWVLAALADITGGGHKLIHEISQALKNEGLLDPVICCQAPPLVTECAILASNRG